jgi:hypothetical protein
MEGFGSLQNNYGSGSGSRRTQNVGIRFQNTACHTLVGVCQRSQTCLFGTLSKKNWSWFFLWLFKREVIGYPKVLPCRPVTLTVQDTRKLLNFNCNLRHNWKVRGCTMICIHVYIDEGVVGSVIYGAFPDWGSLAKILPQNSKGAS